MKVLLTGDIHNDFSKLNKLINRKSPELVICAGDFGFWPDVKWADPMENIKPQGSEIFWIDGNHENHWALKNRKSDEIVPDVHYMPRGSVLTLNDGRTIMFMGGARSIDKNLRELGVDWFPEEEITQKDLYDLPDIQVDIMVTHTCPEELVSDLIVHYPEKGIEPSNIALSVLWKIYKPKIWILGHWHVYKELNMKNTKFYVLSTCSFTNEKWWMWLPEK